MNNQLKLCDNSVSNGMVRNMSRSLWDAAWASFHIEDMFITRCTRENGVHRGKFFLISDLKDSIDAYNNE